MSRLRNDLADGIEARQDGHSNSDADQPQSPASGESEELQTPAATKRKRTEKGKERHGTPPSVEKEW